MTYDIHSAAVKLLQSNVRVVVPAE